MTVVPEELEKGEGSAMHRKELVPLGWYVIIFLLYKNNNELGMGFLELEDF